MYRTASLNSYYDGVKFDSLAKAKAFADKVTARGEVCDVIYIADKKTFRFVYSGVNSKAGSGVRGTYQRGEQL